MYLHLGQSTLIQEGDILESRYAVTRRDRTIHSRMREYLYTLTHTPELKTVLLQVGDGVALTVREHQKNREGKRKREKV